MNRPPLENTTWMCKRKTHTHRHTQKNTHVMQMIFSVVDVSLFGILSKSTSGKLKLALKRWVEPLARKQPQGNTWALFLCNFVSVAASILTRDRRVRLRESRNKGRVWVVETGTHITFTLTANMNWIFFVTNEQSLLDSLDHWLRPNEPAGSPFCAFCC